jgi:transcriptional regulator with XRE-family HTH domain
MSLRALETVVGMSNAKISLWENGHRLPSLDDLGQVLDALDVSGDDRERLLAMRREAEGPGEFSSELTHSLCVKIKRGKIRA